MSNPTDSTNSNPASPVAGQSDDNWQERISKLEKENQELKREKAGIYGDAKEERRKRQELEQRMLTIETSLQAAANEPAHDVNEDAQTKAAREFVRKEAEQLVKPLQAELQAARMELQKEKALAWLAKQESKRTKKAVSAEDMEGSDLLNELIAIENETGISGKTLLDSAKADYELWLKRQSDKSEAAKAAEAERDAKIVDSTPESPRSSAPRSGGRVWTKSAVEKLRPEEFVKFRDEIQDAINGGRYDRSK